MNTMIGLVVAALTAFSSPTVASQPARENPGQASSDSVVEPRRILVMLKPLPARFRGSDGYDPGYGSALSKASRDRIGQRIAKTNGARYLGFWGLPEIGLDCVILEVAAGSDASTIVAAIGRDRAVEWAEPMEDYRTLNKRAYNDPLYPASPAAKQWRLDQLHPLATGKGVSVAIVDSAVDGTHPDLQGQVRMTRDFVEGRPTRAEPHGTAVAGIVSARANNSLGIVGVAPDARLLGLRACWQTAERSICNSLSLAKAIHFAIVMNVDVLNLSLAGPHSRLLTVLLDRAMAEGIVVVASVDPGTARGSFPASHPGVVAVTDRPMALLRGLAYQAPGSAVPTTRPDGRWLLVDGSSFAAAHVSGLFALMIERRGQTGNRLALVRAADGAAIDALESLKKSTAR